MSDSGALFVSSSVHFAVPAAFVSGFPGTNAAADCELCGSTPHAPCSPVCGRVAVRTSRKICAPFLQWPPRATVWAHVPMDALIQATANDADISNDVTERACRARSVVLVAPCTAGVDCALSQLWTCSLPVLAYNLSAVDKSKINFSGNAGCS